jgi:hypothetical protein
MVNPTGTPGWLVGRPFSQQPLVVDMIWRPAPKSPGARQGNPFVGLPAGMSFECHNLARSRTRPVVPSPRLLAALCAAASSRPVLIKQRSRGMTSVIGTNMEGRHIGEIICAHAATPRAPI